MTELIRFGVSLEKGLLSKFDQRIKNGNYTNRSEAIRDLIREDLIKGEWQEGKDVAGSITLVYDHHKRQLLNYLMDVQHDFHHNILSTQHIHLDHNNCLEVIVVKGDSQKIETLYGKLRSVKGVKHASFGISTTGKNIG
ncbi:MAG: nickel-responsive transcriptional regulator NikR [Candidatus Omnitrophica bacterium]|nr:nickel-responsive transcriptional regulator NikR [Candidatus Omnitrophota bacterium]